MLTDPTNHKDWLSPHSIEWYAQLGKLSGVYTYPWRSTVEEPNGESMFTSEVEDMVAGKKVLDVGCGHGEFTRSWGPIVKSIVGFDVTEDFLRHEQLPMNVRFVLGNSKEGLPFEKEAFDCAYNRKGPTSAYPDLRRVVKEGGQILGLHPGDDLCKELPEWFPGFFNPMPDSTPILYNLQERLQSYKDVEIKRFNTKEYLHSPIDVIRLRSFGQTEAIYEAYLYSLPTITEIFEKHAIDKGLPVTLSRYIVKAIV